MKFNTGEVIDRLQQALCVKNDEALSEAMGLKRGTFADWRKRDSLPIQEIVDIAHDENLDLNWLLRGRERGQRQHVPAEYIQPVLRAVLDRELSTDELVRLVTTLKQDHTETSR